MNRTPPGHPEAALAELAAGRRVSRRAFMGLLAGTAATVGGAQLLEACGVSGIGTASPSPSTPLPIGVAQALTGSLASSFKPLFAPLTVAVREINAAGGILGRQIHLDVQDDEGKPADEPTLARTFVGNGDGVVIGPVGSSQALAMAEGLKSQKVILGPLADLESLGDPKQYPFSFRITRTTSARVALGTDWALGKSPAKKVGVLYENTAFGQASAPEAMSRLQAAGVKPVTYDSFEQLTSSFTPFVLKLKQAGAEAVALFSAVTGDNLHLLSAMASVGYTPYIAVTSAAVLDQIATNPALAAFKDRVGIPQFVNLVYTPGKPLGARQQRYAKAVAALLGPNDPKADVMAGPFYDFVYVLKHAIESAKSFEHAKVLAAMERTKDFDGMVCRITFTPSNHSAVTVDNAHEVLAMATQTDPSAPESLGGLVLKKA
jgi:ABC-type branched-subunit amino acid transport system substrate-binding protein